MECPYECIGEEGRSRILPLMDRHGIQTCFGGHVHLNSYREVNRKHFITTASFVNRPAGYRVIELEGSELRARWVPLPADGLEPVSAHLKEDLESSEGIHFRFFDGDTHEQDVRLKLI